MMARNLFQFLQWILDSAESEEQRAAVEDFIFELIRALANSHLSDHARVTADLVARHPGAAMIRGDVYPASGILPEDFDRLM